jgi:hypothetical protein
MPRNKKNSKNFLGEELPSSSTVENRVSQFVRTVNTPDNGMTTPPASVAPAAIDLTGAPKKPPPVPRKKKATAGTIQALQNRVTNAIQQETIPPPPPPVPSPTGSESENEGAAKNSKGFDIINPPGFNTPPVKRPRVNPQEQQISPAYGITDAINVYIVRKSWDRASRDYVQLERLYTNNLTKKESVFNFSFDVKNVTNMISGLQQLAKFYETELETTDDDED